MIPSGRYPYLEVWRSYVNLNWTYASEAFRAQQWADTLGLPFKFFDLNEVQVAQTVVTGAIGYGLSHVAGNKRVGKEKGVHPIGDA